MVMSPHALMMRVEVVCVMVMVMVACLSLTGTKAEEHYSSSCPDDLVEYTDDFQHTCLNMSNFGVWWMYEAHDECVATDSSLMMIQTEEKYRLLEDRDDGHTPVWIGLVSNEDGVFWLTKDKNVSANELPSVFAPYIMGHFEGLQYRYGRLQFHFGYPAYFICEQRLPCQEGWFGERCEKQCHCYQEMCDVMATEMKCRLGCEIGWMGNDCTILRQDPSVQYFCVNAKEGGMHAYIMVDTHGMKNMSIEPINDEGQSMHWCDTSIHQDHNTNVITVTIYVSEETKHRMENKTCPGKFSGDLKYEWIIQVRETRGIVSSNDIYRRLVCDFSKADDMEIGTGSQSIKRELYHRNGEIRKKVQFLDESKEKVKMLVVYPLSEKAITKTMKIGSPVALKINYGVNKENKATGIIPFNCNATSPDLSQSVTFVDRRGCPVPGFPIKEFRDSNISPREIVSNAFPLFGFEKTTKVSFVCSYKLCFGEDPCHKPFCDRHHYPSTRTTTTPDYYGRTTWGYNHTGFSDRWWHTDEDRHHWNSTTTTTRYPFRRRRSIKDELDSAQEEAVSGTVLIEP